MPEALGCTPSQTVGPFLSIGLIWADGPELVQEATPGAILIEGVVTDGAGEPVPDALIEIWQADPLGRFPHPDDPRGASTFPGFRAFGRCPTDPAGRYWFRTLLPGAVPDENGRPQAPHLDVSVFARGLLDRLVTRIYFPGNISPRDISPRDISPGDISPGDTSPDHAVTDPVLATLAPRDRALLTATAGRQGSTFRFDIRMQGDGENGAGETPFFAL